MTDWMAERLLTGSVQGAVVIALVWLACRRLPWMPVSVQAALWWVASLKMVVALLPLPAIPLPLLPPPDLPPADLAVLDLMTRPAEPAAIGSWVALLMAIWVAGLLVQGVHLLFAFRRLRGAIRRSTPLTGERAAVAGRLAPMTGVTRIPEVRTSDEIEAPLVAGVRRPVVLVPATLADDDLPMAMCHELMHVRRHDLLLGWMPALAERLFFFHPLARLAAREYVMSREAACDAAVVRALGVPPDQYGRLLVRLGIARSEPAVAAGGAPASISSLRRRLDMLQHPTIAGGSRRWTLTLRASLAAVAILVIVPFELSATSPLPQAAPAPSETAAQAIETPPRQQIAPRPEPQELDPSALIERRARAELEVLDANKRLEQILESQAGRQSTEEAARTEKQLRDHVERLARQLEDIARRDRLLDQSSLEKAHRENLIEAERAFEEQRLAELRVRERSESLTVQLEILRKQQDELLRHMQMISEQQKALADAQRQIAAETERLREALKSR